MLWWNMLKHRNMCVPGDIFDFLKTVIEFSTWINRHFFNATHYATWQMHVYVGIFVENDV
jgi:hypothetical protein